MQVEPNDLLVRRATSLAALRDSGLGHLAPGPFGEEAVAAGRCYCGCGEIPNIAQRNCARDRMVKGRPIRTLFAHRNRIPLPDQIEVEDSGCWIWVGARRGATTRDTCYGVRRIDAGVVVPVFVWFYEEIHGTVPDGLLLDHLCRTPPCVNPAHMEPVTVAENTRRGASATLSHEAVASIRALRADGWTQQAIGDRYGVTQQSISKALNGVTWFDERRAA